MSTSPGEGWEYPKVYGPFMRHTQGPERNRLDTRRWGELRSHYPCSTVS